MYFKFCDAKELPGQGSARTGPVPPLVTLVLLSSYMVSRSYSKWLRFASWRSISGKTGGLLIHILLWIKPVIKHHETSGHGRVIQGINFVLESGAVAR